ncbi:MAG: CDP-alcohol phosphatidyltransferase family protein [Dehalococcoidales bacterium]|nr:CDP-alcohol phosphatidyltransferase family protein [Dehalococcoidales bacterium]
MEETLNKRTVGGYLTRPVVRILAKTRMTPNDLTWLGFGLTLGAVALVVSGHLLAAGFMVLLSSFFDMLDGALARGTNQVTRFGAILDSTLDRMSEAGLFLGILVFYALNATPRSTMIILLAGIAMIASFLVSYVRARAEGAGLDCEVGLLTRTERVVVLILGLLLSRIDYVLVIALGVIGILSSVTVGQRLVYVWRQTRKSTAK